MTDKLKQQLLSSSGRQIFIDYLTGTVKKPELIDTFDALTNLYLQVNSMVNISALKSADDIYVKHYLDSIYPCEYFEGTVCDVGCGGGFPTLPLAIVTGLTVTGLDSVGKKLLLIKRCISELNLKNVKAEYARSEDLVKLHRVYDTVCARAVADSDKVLTFTAPLTRQGGRIILYKTQNDNPARPAIEQKLGVKLKETVDYELPGTNIKRRLFIYKK